MERIIKSILIIIPIIGCLAYFQYNDRVIEVNESSVSVEEDTIEWITLQEPNLVPQESGVQSSDHISIMNQRFYQRLNRKISELLRAPKS